MGHISRLANISDKLSKQGYQVYVALKDLSHASQWFKNVPVKLFQAPIWLPKVTMQRPIACLADSLLLLGYLEAETLSGLVAGWTSLIESIQPDLIIFDYAPTAMLAAKSNTKIPKITVGAGFADPEPGQPIVDWRPQATQDKLVEQQEERVLQIINRVLCSNQLPALKRLSDLFQVNQTIITTFPDLDPYQHLRCSTTYCLQETNSASRPDAVFTNQYQNKILGYLKPNHPNFDHILSGLSKCKADVFIACPQGNSHALKPYESQSFRFSTKLINLENAMQNADLFVGHGNMGSLVQAMYLGVPSMIFPIQLEQLTTGLIVQKLGIGRLIQKLESKETLTKHIEQLYQSQELKKTCAKYQQENASSIHTNLSTLVNQRCLELLQ